MHYFKGVAKVKDFSGLSKLASVSLAAALIAVAVPAQAAVSQYSDVASFNSALSVAGLVGTTYGFQGTSLVGDPASITDGSLTFSGLNPGYAISGFANDSYGITGIFYIHGLFGQDQTNAFSINFATAVRGFAFTGNVMNPPLGDAINTNNWPASGNADVSLTTSTGELAILRSPLFSNYGSLPIPAPLGFNGIISDTGFTSVTVSVAQGENFHITNYMLAPVPEPETYALMLAGLGLLGAVARRKKTSA
jgi:hypothetical protein